MKYSLEFNEFDEKYKCYFSNEEKFYIAKNEKNVSKIFELADVIILSGTTLVKCRWPLHFLFDTLVPEYTPEIDAYLKLSEDLLDAQDVEDEELEDDILAKLDVLWYKMSKEQHRIVEGLVDNIVSRREVLKRYGKP